MLDAVVWGASSILSSSRLESPEAVSVLSWIFITCHPVPLEDVAIGVVELAAPDEVNDSVADAAPSVNSTEHCEPLPMFT